MYKTVYTLWGIFTNIITFNLHNDPVKEDIQSLFYGEENLGPVV